MSKENFSLERLKKKWLKKSDEVFKGKRVPLCNSFSVPWFSTPTCSEAQVCRGAIPSTCTWPLCKGIKWYTCDSSKTFKETLIDRCPGVTTVKFTVYSTSQLYIFLISTSRDIHT